MTLATKMIVVEPTPYRPIFDEARRLIGAENGLYDEGPNGIENRWGQGFPSWVGVGCGMDAPLTDDCDPEDHEGGGCGYPVKEWSIEVRLDTAYGYRGPHGGGCSALHAWIVRELGRWLTERGLTWYWWNEYDGTWHQGPADLPILGDADAGRLDHIGVLA